jgi:hypothetical protein
MTLVVGTVPPHPALPRYCWPVLEAVGSETATEGVHDTAVMTLHCADMLMAETMDMQAEFIWWHSPYRYGPMYRVDDCPTSTTTDLPTPPPAPGVVVRAWSADCRRPAGSPAIGPARRICVRITLNGEEWSGESPFDGGICTEPRIV